jgi:hypothetical protein
MDGRVFKKPKRRKMNESQKMMARLRSSQTLDEIWKLQQLWKKEGLTPPCLHTSKEALRKDVQNFGLDRVRKALVGRLSI